MRNVHGPSIQLTAWLGIKLLGFKSRKELAFEDNIKHSVFIYPDEMVRRRVSTSVAFIRAFTSANLARVP